MLDDEDLADVVALKLRLLHPPTRRSREAVERLLHPDFREIGASGRLWDRDSIVAALAVDPGDGAQATDVEARFVAEGVVLVTYTSEAGARRARRSSLWLHGEDGWRVLFHQGTLLSD